MSRRSRGVRGGNRRAVANAARAVAAGGEADRLVDGLLARLAPRPSAVVRRLAELGDAELPVRHTAHRPPPGALDHAVTFWGGDRAPAGVIGFLVGAVEAGAPTVVVATHAHRRAILAGLAGAGADVSDALRSGALVCLDAEQVLAALVVDGRVDAVRFDEVIGAPVARAGAGGRRVTAYGEVVALLWGRGDAQGALALEAHWNDLARRQTISLLCGYPAGALDDHAAAGPLRAVCRHHTSVVLADGEGAGTVVG